MFEYPDIIIELSKHLIPDIARPLSMVNKLCYATLPELMCDKFTQITGLKCEWKHIKCITTICNRADMFLPNIKDSNLTILRKLLPYTVHQDTFIDAAITEICISKQFQILDVITENILTDAQLISAIKMAYTFDCEKTFMNLYEKYDHRVNSGAIFVELCRTGRDNIMDAFLDSYMYMIYDYIDMGLGEAIRNDHEYITRRILEHDIIAHDLREYLCVEAAIERGDPDILEFLLDDHRIDPDNVQFIDVITRAHIGNSEIKCVLANHPKTSLIVHVREL